ncbi:hypothetical protein DAPK24_036700 [Pichia kluyveri]|uniref:SAP domain-containing protein n=1 Tax=Pichia kluyveri TaxID=36015 RepID=A0AAV5R6E7_PICKL|nr:hypothetical protein DAPK24_036700 [Pichia kluyveri]
MTKYNTLLKAKLQELLEARGLPIEGTKEVLIERLEESDKVAAELDEDDDVKEDVSEAVTTEPTELTEPTETKEEPKEEPTEATLETRVLELLNTKLKRAIKFNEEELIKRLNSEILRINKFGVSAESAIVHELNGTKPKYTNKVVKRRTPKGFRGRNSKKGHNKRRY